MQVDKKKLQAKYVAINWKWCKIKDQPWKGSSLAPKSNPKWYERIDSILRDTNTDLNKLVSTSLDTSYSQKVIQNNNENESFKDNADDDTDKDLYNDSEDDNESNNANKEDRVENVSANKKKAIVAKSHKKRKVVESQTQALSQLTGDKIKLIESQTKTQKEQMEFEKERDEAFLEFQKEEAKKNRRHELEIAKIFAPVNTGRKLNVRKTFRRRPGRLLNILCLFNLRHVPMGAWSMNNSQQQRDFKYTPFDQTSFFQYST